MNMPSILWAERNVGGEKRDSLTRITGEKKRQQLD